MTSPPKIRSYRLDPAGFESALKARLRVGRRWGVVAMVGGALPVTVLMATADRHVLVTLPVVVPLLVALLAFSFWRGMRLARERERPEWDSYQLTLSPNVLRRFVATRPSVEILRPEVTRILEAPGMGLTVSAGNYRFIFIPEQLEGYAGVRERLALWRAIEPSRPARTKLLQLAWMLCLIGLWLASGMLPNIWLALLAGAALIVCACFSIRETLRLESLANNHKARVVLMLGFFMLAPFARAILYFGFGMGGKWLR